MAPKINDHLSMLQDVSMLVTEVNGHYFYEILFEVIKLLMTLNLTNQRFIVPQYFAKLKHCQH